MSHTTISSKFQIIIPKAIREQMNLQPGQKLTIVVHGQIISLVPEMSVNQLRGFISGINTTGLREKED